MDSIKSLNRSSALRTALNFATIREGNEKQSLSFLECHVPQQNNGNDCGFYMLFFIERALQDAHKSPHNILRGPTPPTILQMRREMNKPERNAAKSTNSFLGQSRPERTQQ